MFNFLIQCNVYFNGDIYYKKKVQYMRCSVWDQQLVLQFSWLECYIDNVEVGGLSLFEIIMCVIVLVEVCRCLFLYKLWWIEGGLVQLVRVLDLYFRGYWFDFDIFYYCLVQFQ